VAGRAHQQSPDMDVRPGPEMQQRQQQQAHLDVEPGDRSC
jgi:hypothetical protein